jgi:hypothetical protein
MLCMVVYLILGRSVGKNANIGVISVCQNTYMLLFKGAGEEVGRPENFRLVCGPCVIRVAVQAVNEDNAVREER